MTDSFESRKLSCHERFCVARRNAGFAHPIVFLLTYATAASLPSVGFLSQRVSDLQDHFPFLYAKVEAERTSKPRFVTGQKWDAKDIILEETYDPEPSTGNEEERISREKGRLIKSRIDRIGAKDTAKESLWNIALLKSSSDPQGTAYLAFSTDHIIVDGMGFLILLRLLLAPVLPTDLPYEKLSAIPLFDDTFDLRPSYFTLIPTALRELVLPKLPMFVQNLFKEDPIWPGSNFKLTPTSAPGALHLCEIPSGVVGPLKIMGRRKNVSTLHPIIHTAFNVAIWGLWGSSSPNNAFHMKTMTATNVRDYNKGHAHAMACYSGFVSRSSSWQSSSDFWVEAKSFNDYLKSDQAKRDGPIGMGMLNYIPDGPGPFPASGIPGASDEGKTPTGWERFFWDKALSPSPFGTSMNISNLAYIPIKPLSHLPQADASAPSGPSDLVWGQMPTPFGPPLGLSVCGTENGMAVCIGFRDGSAVTRQEVEKLAIVFKTVLRRLGEGTGLARDLVA